MNPIWYFDATGSVIKKVKSQMHFLYSIVMHDSNEKQILPLAEFVSCSQNQTWVCKNLFFIKEILKQNIRNKNKYVLAPIIVTDFSFALINAIQISFNRSSLLQYLKWTFDILILKKKMSNMMLCRSYLCSTHFLKNVSFKAKLQMEKLKIKDNNILITFLFSFGLLQNCTRLEIFDGTLMNIFHIFNQPSENSLFSNALLAIREKLSDRDDGISLNLNKDLEVLNELKDKNNENAVFSHNLIDILMIF